MIQKAMSWLLGEAPTGQRKYVLCMTGMTMVFVYLMWGPGNDETQRFAIGAFLSLAVTFVTGNVKEHQAQAQAKVAING